VGRALTAPAHFHCPLGFRESASPDAWFPRMKALGRSVNAASRRFYTGGYGPVGPGPIGLGLGGFPGTPLLGSSVNNGNLRHSPKCEPLMKLGQSGARWIAFAGIMLRDRSKGQ
jgi:hypothetical protein